MTSCPIISIIFSPQNSQNHGLRAPNELSFHRNHKSFWAWADRFGGIWGIFGQFISTHFGTVSPLSMFFINQPLFLQKLSKSQIFIWDWDLNLDRKEFGIKPSGVRSP